MTEPCVMRADIQILKHETERLRDYEANQNGHLGRLAISFDEERIVVSQRFDKLGEKLDRLYYSVLGLAVSVIGGMAIWSLTH